MKVPVSWLKQYVPIDISAKELAHLLTMAGNEVGEVEEIGGNWDREKVVVGYVLKVDPHPDADRLRLPTVDLGNSETITVVCGAPNVAEGQKIEIARHHHEQASSWRRRVPSGSWGWRCRTLCASFTDPPTAGWSLFRSSTREPRS